MMSRRLGSEDPLVTEALASMTALERIVWGSVIRRNLNRPGTRLSRMIPKLGIRAATQSVLGNVWLAPVFLGFIAIPLLQTSKPSVGAEFIGFLLAGIAAMYFRSLCIVPSRRVRRGAITFVVRTQLDACLNKHVNKPTTVR